jgi:hypothetical protein
MDVLVELFVTTVIALAAAVFAQFGVSVGDADGGEARAVRRSPVAMSAPAAERVVTRIAEECDEAKAAAGRAMIHADLEAVVDEGRLEAAVATAVAQAEKDIEAAVRAAEIAQAWAEAEAARNEAVAERARALAERRAEQAAA